MKQLIVMIPETDAEKANHDLFHNFRNADASLTEAGNTLVEVAIGLLNEVCFKNSFQHGWYEKYMSTIIADHNTGETQDVLAQRNFGEVMALITSEVSEAFEAYRDGDDQTQISYGYKDSQGNSLGLRTIPIREGVLGKPEGIAAELADVLIRVFDYAGAYGVPLAEAVIRKHLYNQTRPYRHGGKLA